MSDPTQPPNDEMGTVESKEKQSIGHPLFPRGYTETGPDRRRIVWIQLVRYLPDGTREVCPKMYKASELRSWQQVVDEHGGESTYQAGGQDEEHRFTAWSEKCFFGSPPRKAFSGGPWVPKQEPANAAPAPSPQTTQDALLLTLVKLLAERRDPPPPPPPNPAELLHGVAALLNGLNRGPSGIEMVKEMMPLMHGGERTSRMFMQGIDFARDMMKNAPAPEPARSNSDDLSMMMDLAKLFTAVRPANTPAPAAPVQTPAPAPNPPQQSFPVPPCLPPSGYGWMFTQEGWVAFPLGITNTQFANRPAPIPAAPAPATPMPQINDEDAVLRKLLEHPEMRAKLVAMLGESPRTPAPVPHPAPPAPPPAPITPPVTSAPPGAVLAHSGAFQTPVQAISSALGAAGWSFTPAPETPVAMHYTKPPEPPAPAPMVSPGQPPPNASFMIPDNVPMDDELRATLGNPEFQKLAFAVVGPESQEAFAKLVQQNAHHLREIPEA
jgi:hypothetical protein